MIWKDPVNNIARYSYIHGPGCIPAVLHSSIHTLRHKISSNNTATGSTRHGRSIKCVAATVCCIYRTSTYHVNLVVSSYATSTDLHVAKMRIAFRLAEYAHGSRSSIPTHEAYKYMRLRLCPHATCPYHTQLYPSRSHHAWDKKQFSRPQRKKVRGRSYKLPTIKRDSWLKLNFTIVQRKEGID